MKVFFLQCKINIIILKAFIIFRNKRWRVPKLYINLAKQPLPTIYCRNHKKCYLDPIRKKLVYLTPEETIRQLVISYLIRTLKVPKKMISVEEPLSHYGISSIRRTDIVIKGLTYDNRLIPIAVIECKAPGIGLGEQTAKQLTYYCNALGCDYAMMINDISFFCYHYDESTNQYIQISALPKYDEMITDKYKPYIPEPIPERIEYSQISHFVKENLDVNSRNISCTTEHPLACASWNLEECFLDISHKIPIGQYSLFEIIKDYGIRMLTYGNAGGGTFYGPYRSFLIKFNGNVEIVSFGFSTYVSSSKPDVCKTALNIAIDNEKTSHHSLQLVIDDNVIYKNNQFTFYHHGRIAIGNRGSGKVSELRKLVLQHYPEIINGKQIDLGSLIYNKLWYLDDPSVVKLVENLISYALIRDKYRMQKNLI